MKNLIFRNVHILIDILPPRDTMADPRVEKLAKLVVNYSIYCKKGDEVLIAAPTVAEPLAIEMYREVLKAGGYPLLLPSFSRAQEIFWDEAKDHQIKFISDVRKLIYRSFNGLINISADTNTRALTSVPPKKQAMQSAAMTDIREIFMTRGAKKELKWCGLAYPTNASAQEASMSLTEYEDFVYDACLVNKRDPIAAWKKMHNDQKKMTSYLNKVGKLEFYGEDTELRMSVKGRIWVNSDGRHNMPSGEVFTAPIENSVEGKIRFTFPGIYLGK